MPSFWNLFFERVEYKHQNTYQSAIQKLTALNESLPDYPPRYYALLLNRELLPAAFKPAYSVLFDGYKKNQASIKLPLPRGASAKELLSIHSAVLNDHPDLYYISNEISFTSGKNPTIKPHYTISTSERERYDIEIASKVNEIASKAPEGSFARERYVNDCLLNMTKYGNSEDPRSHSVIGALIDGLAVCDGYSKCASILMNAIGVPCCVVSGKLEGSPHSWNIVEINGERYHIDITNNGDNLLRDCYFNLSDRMASRTHEFLFRFGCTDDSHSYGNRACSLQPSDVPDYLTGFFSSGDSKTMIEVENYSESLFERDVRCAMRQCNRTMSCNHSSNEDAGLYAIEKIQ